MLAESPPETITCIYFPSKAIYETADEASCALRQVAINYMERNVYDPRLIAFDCHGHYHLGRTPARTKKGA